MGLIFGLIKWLIKWSIYLAVFAAIVVLIPNLPPYTKFTSIEIEPTQSRVGPLAPNTILNNVEKLYENKVLGPEAFQLHNGELYTSLATGEIVKLSPGGHVTFVAKIGEPCTGLSQEHICGRPLGFEIDEKSQLLYVADAYHGIWKVDLKNNKKQLLVSSRAEIEGRLPKLFNSLTLAQNGDFYWTDSSSDFVLKDGAYIVLVDPSGRLFHYNAAKNQSKVLLDNMWFPNGVVKSPDNQFVLVSETGRYRIQKYYIAGPKKGKSEVFVSGLPGTPDNMRVLPDGSGVLVGLYTVFDEEHPLLTKSLAPTPMFRKFLARLQRLIEIPFEFLNTQFPNVIFEDIVYKLGHFTSVSGLMSGMSGLVQIDWNGNIVASYFSTDKSYPSLSDAIVYNDKLYVGSPHNHFIGAVPAPALLKKAFSSVKSSPPTKTVEKEVPKPQVEKPQQAKPVETPKPKVQEKPKEEKKEIPKAKPAAQEPPKHTQPPKPAEKVKVTTPKPVEKKEQKREPVKVSPKPAEKKPEAKVAKPTPAPAQEKPTTPKPVSAKPEQKEAKAATPKPTESKPAAPKSESKPAKPKKTESETKQKSRDKPLPDQIPIKEEIPSDTVKPNKEKLKVIKRDGPAEIPNPAL